MPRSRDTSAQLIEILRTRRDQVGFRASIAALMALFFTTLLGVVPMALWAASYCALQLLEIRVYPRAALRDEASGVLRTGPALALLFMNGVVFGSASVMWATLVGTWGFACGGFLLAGSMLNVVLTTPGSRPAFFVSIAPYLVYVAVTPLFAIGESGTHVALALAVAGAMMAYCAIKLWMESSRARASEIAARRELAAREAAAVGERAFLDAVVENVPAMIVVKAADSGRFVLLNNAGESLLGLDRAQVIGKTDHDLFPAEQADAFVAADQEVIASGALLSIPSEQISTAQGERTLRTRKVVIGAGASRHLLVVAEDITELEEAARSLQQALVQAEAANAAKSAFLATISHEIRTPLNGVLGMAQAMAAEPLAPAQQGRLKVIQASGEGLLAILNDVLDLSKIEAGKLEFEEIAFDLEDLVRDAHAAFAHLAAHKGLGFTLDLAGAEGAYRGDPTRIRQVLNNLLSNALKFTEAGEVTLSGRCAGGAFTFEVADTGIGMAPSTLAQLFTSFSQADASTTRRFGGSGLGLAISRNLVELMGGAISVASAEGQGSRFKVSLPLPRAAADELPAPAGNVANPGAEPQPGLRVLAAEDNEINQLVLRTLLQQVGVEPVLVDNGRLALAAYAAGAFDLVLMDVQMPEMDGPAAARLIRRHEAETGRARTPIIALTANVMSHQIAEYRDAGMDGHVAKPIEAARLFATLEAAISDPTAATPVSSAESRAQVS